MTNEENSIKDNIERAIGEGKITMRPRWHFVLRTSLLLSGVILAVLVLIYIVSFVIFVLHQTGAWSVSGFGARGIGEFLVSFPWVIVVVAILFIIILETLVTKYSFGYRKPLLYTTVGISAFVLVGGFGVAATSFHRGLFDSAREEHLPLAGSFYRQFGTPHSDNVAIGSITQIIDDTGYTIQDRRDETFEIIFNGETDFPDGKNFQVGDSIAVLGDRNDGNIIQAVGVRKVTGTEPPPSPHGDHGPGQH